MNVFDIEELGTKVNNKNETRAIAARPRDCTMCRECIRTNGWENGDRVKLQRVASHFIFTVESTGCIPPEILVKQVIFLFIYYYSYYEIFILINYL